MRHSHQIDAVKTNRVWTKHSTFKEHPNKIYYQTQITDIVIGREEVSILFWFKLKKKKRFSNASLLTHIHMYACAHTQTTKKTSIQPRHQLQGAFSSQPYGGSSAPLYIKIIVYQLLNYYIFSFSLLYCIICLFLCAIN